MPLINSVKHKSQFTNEHNKKCSDTAKLYFHDGKNESLKTWINHTNSTKTNPACFDICIGPKASADALVKLINTNISDFHKTNPECKSITIKFYTYANEADSRIQEIKTAVIQTNPKLKIGFTEKCIEKESSSLNLYNTRLKNNIVTYAEKLNISPNFMYQDKFYPLHGEGKAVGSIEKYLSVKNEIDTKYQESITKNIPGMKFEIINLIKEYVYKGKNFSDALDKLIKHEPFLLECRLFCYICILLSIRDELGNVKFNQLISAKFADGFRINPDNMFKLFYESKFHFVTNLSDISNTFIKGDLVFIRNINSSAFHPASSANSYNLFCIGKNQDKEYLFYTFGSEQPETLVQWQENLKKLSDNNLTYADLQFLHYYHNTDETPKGSSYSYNQAWKLLIEHNTPEKIENELNSLKGIHMENRYNLSSIEVPKSIDLFEINVGSCIRLIPTILP